MTQPTILERYHDAYSAYKTLRDSVDNLKKRRKAVPGETQAQLNAAHEKYQSVLAEFNAAVSGRK